MTRMLEKPIIAIGSETSFSISDRVTLLFEYRFSQEASWSPLDYKIDGVIVGGLQACDRPDDPFEPHVMPDRELPEGQQYATGHPFKLDEEPFKQKLEDCTVIELRYLAIHADVLTDADSDMHFAEATI